MILLVNSSRKLIFNERSATFLLGNLILRLLITMLQKNCSDKAMSVFKELKSTLWKYIDRTWYDELMHDKEVELLDLVKLGCVSSSGIITCDDGYDVPDTQRAYVIIQDKVFFYHHHFNSVYNL